MRVGASSLLCPHARARGPLRTLLAVALWLAASMFTAGADAQQPKLDLTLQLGTGAVIFVPREQGQRHGETHAHIQIAFGARYRHRALMAATNLTFRFWNAFDFTREFVEGSQLDPALIGAELLGYSFELPLLAGYIPYRNPYFKVFLYGGLVNQFNLRFRLVEKNGHVSKLGPADLEFPVYQALCRFGFAFDVTLFNFDLNYNIGLNSATQTDTRTNVHVVSGNLGMLF